MVRRLAAGTGAGSALPRDPNACGEARSVRKVASSASVLIAAARWAGFPRRAISRRMCGGMMQDNGPRVGCEHMCELLFAVDGYLKLKLRPKKPPRTAPVENGSAVFTGARPIVSPAAAVGTARTAKPALTARPRTTSSD